MRWRGGAYLVRAELPGMKSDDVDIELRGNELRVTGEVKEEKEQGEGKPLSRAASVTELGWRGAGPGRGLDRSPPAGLAGWYRVPR
jgi:hypothetical protein